MGDYDRIMTSDYIRRPKPDGQSFWDGQTTFWSAKDLWTLCVFHPPVGGTSFPASTISPEDIPQWTCSIWWRSFSSSRVYFFNYPSRKFQEIYKKPHWSPMQLPGCCCSVVVSSLTPCSNYFGWPVLCAGQGDLPHHQAGHFANTLLDTGNAVLPRTTTEKIQGKQNSDHIHRPTHQDIIPTIAAETAMLKLGPPWCLGLKPTNRDEARSGGNPKGLP